MTLRAREIIHHFMDRLGITLRMQPILKPGPGPAWFARKKRINTIKFLF
jgi:hypothetical protein